jgi:hypothetical protein
LYYRFSQYEREFKVSCPLSPHRTCSYICGTKENFIHNVRIGITTCNHVIPLIAPAWIGYFYCYCARPYSLHALRLALIKLAAVLIFTSRSYLYNRATKYTKNTNCAPTFLIASSTASTNSIALSTMPSLLVSISYPISRSSRNTNSVSCERRTALQEAVNDIKTQRAKQLTA